MDTMFLDDPDESSDGTAMSDAANDHPEPMVWWPPRPGVDDPSAFELVIAGADDGSGWSAEAWPRIGADGRLHRGAKRAFDPASLPVFERSAIGAALEAMAPTGATRDEEFAVLAVGPPGGTPSSPADRVVPIGKDLLEAAVAAEWRPYAWTLWEHWRGDVELLFHVGRAVAGSVEGTTPSRMRIVVWTSPEDFEEFESPHAFRDDLTQYAARRMRSVEICAAFPQITARIRCTRDQHPADPWLRHAVLLEVDSSDPQEFAAVRAAHNRVRTALARGEPKGYPASGTMVGFRPVEHGGPTDGRVTRLPIDAVSTGTYWVPLVIVALLGLFLGSLLIDLWTWAPAAFAMVLTWVLLVSWFLGGFKLGGLHRAPRLRSWLLRLAALGLGPAVGYGVKAALDSML